MHFNRGVFKDFCGHSWRFETNEDNLKDISRDCARTYVKGSMQKIMCKVPLVLLSPTTVTNVAQAHHYDIKVKPNEKLPDLNDRRSALEQEVASLKEKLTHEMKLREALKGCLRRSPGSLPQIPGYIPAEMRQLLFEVAVLEEEVVFLEEHAVHLRREIQEQIEPGLCRSFRLDGEEEIVSVSEEPTALEIEIPESEVSDPLWTVYTSQPTTPMVPMSPLSTPVTTPEWRPFASSSPPPMHGGSMTSPMSSASPLPLSIDSSPVHDEPERTPPQVLNRKRVARKGSSSSESLAVGKPSRKKPNHQKTQSLPSDVRKSHTKCLDTSLVKSSPVRKNTGGGDVFERLSAPKNGGKARLSATPSSPVASDKPTNAAVKKSTHVKQVKSRYLSHRSPPVTLLNEKVNYCTNRDLRRKGLHSRSPPLASPISESGEIPYYTRSSSNREVQIECSPSSTMSPVFEDKPIASIKRMVSSMDPAKASQLRFQYGNNSPFTPIVELGSKDRLVTPFKLSPTEDTENFKELSLSEEQQRTHDLVNCRSLSPIKLNKPSDQISTHSKGTVQHRLSNVNNFSENAKRYAKIKLSSTPSNQTCKVKPIQAQQPLPKGYDIAQSTPTVENMDSSKLRSGTEDVYDYDKDDKVDISCAPISDASWLPEDLTKLFGTVCSRIRRHSSLPSTKMVAKPPVAALGSSQRIDSFRSCGSFDIRSVEGLQILQEYCSDDMNLVDCNDVRKHRATNVGPHRHHYKALRLSLI